MSGQGKTAEDRRRYHKQWRLDAERGRRRTIPAEMATAHVRALLAAGATIRGISATSGVNYNTVSRLQAGHLARVYARHSDALMRINIASITGRQDREGYVPAIGALRRIEAMLYAGHPHADISAAADGIVTNVLLAQRPRWIHQRRHASIDSAFRKLGFSTGPSDVTRARARRSGYAPAAAWDDIDDPQARPVGVLPPPQRRTVEALAAVTQRLAAGDDLSTVAADMGVTPRALDERAYRYWVRTGDRTALDLIRVDGVPK